MTKGSGRIMFKLDRIDIQRIAAAAVGALFLTTAFVGAAVAPARAVETGPLLYAQSADVDGVRA